MPAVSQQREGQLREPGLQTLTPPATGYCDNEAGPETVVQDDHAPVPRAIDRPWLGSPSHCMSCSYGCSNNSTTTCVTASKLSTPN
jgi:hypothetical protein